jgi:hypothetical protein
MGSCISQPSFNGLQVNTNAASKPLMFSLIELKLYSHFQIVQGYFKPHSSSLRQLSRLTNARAQTNERLFPTIQNKGHILMNRLQSSSNGKINTRRDLLTLSKRGQRYYQSRQNLSMTVFLEFIQEVARRTDQDSRTHWRLLRHSYSKVFDDL